MKRGTRLFVAVVSSAWLLGGCKHYDLDKPSDRIAAGKRYVADRKCGSCHQSPSSADGILSGQTSPRPGTMAYGDNLTPDVTTGLGAWADIEIVRAMRAGVDHAQMVLCPTMPRYDGSDAKIAAMTDLEADLIVDYLRSLPAVSRTIPPSVCPPIEPPAPPDLSVVNQPLDLSLTGDLSISDGSPGD
jgi:hypothetical protein